jgi:tetratricopeptide (TPR) repeat protein/TolB-like protein/predicted Ser/Thr protein kinase
MIGRTIAHYRVVERLGGGGMGVVYAADDEHLQRHVALKFLPRDLSADPLAVERFQREARAASALAHPNICTIHDIGSIDEADGVHHYIVMELLDGRNLKQVIDGRPLAIDTILEIGIQIADALDIAHAKGIVHRDIKPTNIVVTDRGQAKVLDFGVAKLTAPAAASRASGLSQMMTAAACEPLTNPGDAIGTIDYMSPEQARGEDVDARSDLYALGLVLYEMATGQPAVGGRTSALIYDAILHETPPPVGRVNPKVSADLERIIGRAIEKDRRLRYQTAADLAAELRRVKRQIDSGTVSPAEPSSTAAAAIAPPVAPAAPRRRVAIGVAAALVLLATAGVFYFLGNRTTAAAGIGSAGRPAIAVVDFENPEGNSDSTWVTTALPGMLLTGLGQTAGLDVIGRQRVDEVLKEIGVAEGARIDPGRVLDVGRRAGAGAMVVGSVFKVGSEYRIDAQVQEVSTGRLLGAHSVRGADVFALADDLTGRILSSLHVASAEGARSVAEITSKSTEAYKLYSEGQRAVERLRQPEARKLLEAAVAIDPTFAAAWLELAAVAGGMDDRGAEVRYRQKVVENIDRLTERQRLLFEASELGRSGKPEAAIPTLEKALEKYPDEETAYMGLMGIYRNSGDLQKALDVGQRAVKALPESGRIRNTYGYLLLDSARYPEALREFETYARLDPNQPNPLDSQAEVYLLMSQPDRALERYARVLEIEPTFVSASIGRTVAFGMLGRFDDALKELERAEKINVDTGEPTIDVDVLTGLVLTRAGRYREAEPRYRRALATAQKFEDPWSIALIPFLEGLTAIERGDYAAASTAAAQVERQLASSPPRIRQQWGVLPLAVQGVAEARAGRLDAARATLQQAQRAADLRRTYENFTVRTIEGEIALATGDLAAAERAFAAADPPLKMFYSSGGPATSLARNNLPFRDGTARVLALRGNIDGAIDAYRRLLALDVTQKWTAILEPRLVLQLAQLLERKGDRAAARQEYQRFLDLWQKADPGLPEVTSARQRIRALTAP